MIATFVVDLALYVAITLILLKMRDLAANYPNINWSWFPTLSASFLSFSAMLHPYRIEAHYFDLRYIPLLLLSYLKGWKAGLAAALLPAAYRLYMGGDSAAAESVVTMVLPVLLGAMFHDKSEKSEYKLPRMADVLISVNLFYFVHWFGGLVFTQLPLYQWTEISIISSLFGNLSAIAITWIYNDYSRNRIIKREYEKLSNYDSKTGLPNIRFFHEKAATLASNQPIFLLMIDIDHFKHYNDAHGHIIGDGLLSHFGTTIKQSIGEKGFVARYGGEEFVAVLPVDSKDTACAIAEWVRSDIEHTSFSGSEKQPYGKLTVSIGVSGPSNDLSTLIQHAEEALIVAKHQGKNRYCFYGDVSAFVDRTQLEQERDFFKNHYESILEASGDGICGLDSQGKITFANPAAVRLTGYPQDELVGKEIHMLFADDPSAAAADFPITMTLRDGVLRHQLDAPLYRKNDLPLSVEYICSPMIDRDRVLGGVVTFIDITERKKLQELARKADRMDVIGNTAEGIAHEIRNPLTTLKGFLQLCKPKLDPNHFETMRRELDQIEFVVRELLIVSKPHELQLRETDLLDCVKQSIHSAKGQAFLQKSEIHFDHTDGIPTVYGDPNRLAQLVLHLIRNALDSLEEQGDVDVLLTADRDEDTVILTIRDNGKGMPEDIVQKLGEPFYSTKTNGIGLGMTLCNQIVQQHKGELIVESAMNEGTTVIVKFPSYSKISAMN
ncbi:diguanylate cyclase domain-containing protein [Paenibacillus alkalitolerans]|uniref:diguanylate cyclase domain-containing protein n=1 Tax=Paenibacillus alkalitolerans TaxID=2799335 RepID=UPI0018F388D5|nr:diguanylate cyclase [Paenibacillus alkalitolerans]